VDFYQHNQRTLVVFTIAVLILLTVSRVVNLLVFGDWGTVVANSGLVPPMLLRGLRFDLKLLAVILLLVAWIPALFPARALPVRIAMPALRYALLACLLLVTFVVFIEFGYLSFYAVPIDLLVFGFLEDDTAAIFKTILDNAMLVMIFVLFLIAGYVITRIYLRQTKPALAQTTTPWPRSRKLAVRVVGGVLLILLARGSLDTFPLQRKSASVGDDPYINSLVMNAPFNLYYAWQDKQNNASGVFASDMLKTHDIADFETLLRKAGYSDDYPLIATTATQAPANPHLPHVVFVLMEGWSSQIALEHGDDNPVLGAFGRHAQEDHFFTHLFANTFATNSTIESLLVNSPVSPLSQSVARSTSFRLSNLLPFKRNGYRTAYVSGGYASWRNHDNFWPRQGFDRYIGRSEIEDLYEVEARDHPWGVYDEYLLRRVEDFIAEADEAGVPSFSFVMTTSNHSPPRLPPSYTWPRLKPELYGFDPGEQIGHDLLAGYHYASDQLGHFLSRLKAGPFAERVVVVATGDHPLRTLAKTNSLAGDFLRYSVPAYFYLPAAIDRLGEVPSNIAASHADLFPTLYELVLPHSEYYRFGEPLMDKHAATAYGWSNRARFVFDDGVLRSDSKQFYRWADGSRKLLDVHASKPNAMQTETIEREAYRRILKTQLLIEDYRAAQARGPEGEALAQNHPQAPASGSRFASASADRDGNQ
jgi:phosphoglycerol transferase MdoB-like AlkP superfamily enzyme